MFLTRRFFIVAVAMVALFVLGYPIPFLFHVARVLLCVWGVVLLIDFWMLYHVDAAEMRAERRCRDRFSNGDPNEVELVLQSPYAFSTRVEVVDEMPIDFQMRDFVLQDKLLPHEQRQLTYTLTPHHRGAYQFDHVRIFFASPIGLLFRRYTRGERQTVKVYPSFARLSLYSLMCNHRLDEYGIKRIRQVGADTDFEQIKDYIQGDEYRHINWKASARAHQLKVNVYQQDRSMPVYSIVDKGRMMQQSSQGNTYLELAINAALALSYVAIKKDDQAGLVTLSTSIDASVTARKHGPQMQLLMESLYAQQTHFAESDYSALSAHFTQRITKRCLAVLFANFATLNALDRELPYLLHIARRHQLLVVLFRDCEMEHFLTHQPKDTEEYYQQISVERYYREKRLIINKLRQNNILTLYTLPEDLSVGIINRYLEYRRF